MKMKKIIIVGAGVSGLSAGIYALQSGFDVEIYEKHFMTGGVCTSWSRSGYTFEGAVHWLTGSAKDSPLYRIWEETDIVNDSIKTYRADPYCVLEYEGEQLCLYRDIQKLETHFLQVSPQDKKVIHQLCKNVKAFMGMGMPVMDEKGVKVHKKSSFTIKQGLKMIPALGKMKKLSALLVSEYVNQFSHKGLRQLLTSVIPDSYGAMSMFFVLATFAKDGHFPEGGALALAKRMTDKYTSLGGKVFLSNKVDKILVENHKATGIIVDGKQILGDGVIITQDVITAVKHLFDHPPTDQWIKDIQANTVPQLCTLMGIGIEAELATVPHQFCFKLKTPITIADSKQDFMGIVNYSGYDGYAPKGCTAITVCFIGDSYDWWAKAKAEGRYIEEKKALENQVRQALEQQFPQIVGKIKVVNTATPLTYERYTGSYKGSWMSIIGKNSTMTIPSISCAEIESLYFAGFRTQNPGGLPVAVSSGRKATQLLCKQWDIVFQGKEKIY